MIPSEGEVSEGEHGSPADEEMLGGTELETAPGRVRDMRVLSLPEPEGFGICVCCLSPNQRAGMSSLFLCLPTH